MKISLENLNKSAKVALALILAEDVIKIIESEEEGYEFCRSKLDMCWDWLNGKNIEVDKFYDCLDNEDEEDIISLTFTTNDKRISNAYGLISEVVSYTAVMVNEKINGGGLPQFLEIVDDKFLEKHIKYVLDNNITTLDKYNKIMAYLEQRYPINLSVQFERINKNEVLKNV